ncbi:MAG TPA: hypothetical protein VIF62_12920 [Labilithrix sp.]|jgi:hypothetical protein
MDEDEENLIAYRIEEHGISLAYPEHWDQRIEENGTHLFWEENTGSLRVTPFIPVAEPERAFDPDAFLAHEHNRRRDAGATYKQLGPHRFLCYVADSADGDGVTRSHFYLMGRGPMVLLCSWSYDRALLDDELSADEVEDELENAEAVLTSLAFD